MSSDLVSQILVIIVRCVAATLIPSRPLVCATDVFDLRSFGDRQGGCASSTTTLPTACNISQGLARSQRSTRSACARLMLARSSFDGARSASRPVPLPSERSDVLQWAIMFLEKGYGHPS
ncbi:hypothetical protein BD626DRAFT_476695 [Schizophyllum amplum]|uniref:Secreted protein n=1 Tax=Schizophyllum amplum TaxID=97359 RepID=A0A550CZL6_9AGAR|nr:hypothetical protein BD626DRAFT_476695 [Auriculariopsis ampla]